MTELQDTARQIHVCTDCPLSEGRANAVPGEGPEDADLMFIGEGPGFNEDRQGRPFVGAAGHFLEELLASIDMKREQVFITNMVKCRPPNNRDPFPVEIAACRKYLDKQIALIHPKVVVTLGRHSLAKFLPGQTIGKAHGKPRKHDKYMVCPMYHPAAALHQQSLRGVIEKDFKVILDLLNEPAKAEESKVPSAQQLSMF